MKNKLRATIHLRLLSLFAILLQVGFIGANFDALTTNRGGSRVFEVMYKGPGGIADINRKTRFAETKNLNFDLNLSEISARFGCLTKMGQVFIAYTLAKPISPLDTNDTIKKRQQLIQLFMDHPELQEKFENLLQQAVEHEAVVMKFLEKRFVMDAHGNPIKTVQQFMKRNLFIQLFEQGSLAANILDAPDTLQKQFPPVRESGGLALESVNKGMISLSNLVTENLFTAGLATTGSVYLASKTSDESWRKISLPAQALLAGTLLLATTQIPGMWDFGKSSRTLLWTAWSTIVGGYTLYSHYVEALEIRNSLYALNRLIHTAKEIEDVCRQHNIEHQFALSSIRSHDGLDLLEELQHDRYTNIDSAFFLTPLVHSFLFEVYERDMNLAPVYASIAEMDAYIAIARKMKQLQSEDNKLSFAQFLDSSKPMIRAQGFWNMLVSMGNVVTNNISEGRNIILTGSNEGGKTTAIRAILQNIVLAQTFGIAAASQFSLTQFDVINSYLNVSDDILNGKSRFASELQQAKDILHRIQALQPTEKFFFAFDELFTGTNGEDGAETAYRFIDNIASYKGIQFIYATHFNKLKTIGANNPACANYKIEPPLRNAQGQFIRDDRGQLIYPYKLSPGANDVNVAMDRARDAGIFA